MPDYAKIAANALKSIAKAGQSIPISRTVPTVNETTGIPVNAAPVTGTLTGVVLPRYKGISFQSMDEALMDAIIKGRAKTVIAAAQGAPFAPRPQDVLTIEGAAWVVIGASTLAPDGTPLLYYIGVKA